MNSPRPRVLLSFDVEEYDLPNDFGGSVGLDEQLAVGREAFERTLELLARLDMPSTLFITARIGEHCADLVRDASAVHEIASHGVRHDRFEPGDYERSRTMLESISGAEVSGFRMARLQPVDAKQARAAGYDYDSSENPIRLPGRYDNRHLPRTPRMEEDLVRIPVSTTPRRRIPLFWLAFRHLPRPLLRASLERTLAADGHLVVFFHPWELLELRRSKHPMPRVVRHGGGKRLAGRIEKELGRLRDRADFCLMRELAASVRADFS
ncbi:MAG: DUF3473 domain-containing protein [Phycisphaerales bacterium]|nr:DUF3473 domain-containing protein [Phycisphaerales bacterium]